jgi:hypothetical protein
VPDHLVVDIAFVVDFLENRPLMLMPKVNYDTIVAYLYGLDYGWSPLSKTKGPLAGFREFLLPRIDNCRSYGWSQLIEAIAERDGKDPRPLLVQLLKEFLQTAPDNSGKPDVEPL